MLMTDTKIKNNKRQNDALKAFGILVMTIDHIGFVFFPQITFLRVIGRLAFPIFAWYLSQGYIHTSNLKKYFLRLGIFALVSQAPYYLVFREWKLNIFFTLLIGLLAIHLFHRKKYVFFVLLVILSKFIPLDYSYYGILIVLGFYAFPTKQLIVLFQDDFYNMPNVEVSYQNHLLN